LPIPEKAPLWRSRGYLPHFDTPGILQSITFRLADSLPRTKLAALEKKISTLPPDQAGVARRKKIEEWMDAGMGCCALRHPEVAVMVQETLLKHDGQRYHLHAWCIMPNHVHVLIEANDSLGKTVQSWKSYTGRWVMKKNAELGLGVPGKALWMREYWDRYIRNEKHFRTVFEYIHRNPVEAGLCRTAAEWPWSSAGLVKANRYETEAGRS